MAEIQELGTTEEELQKYLQEAQVQIKTLANRSIDELQRWLDKTLADRRALLDLIKLDVAGLAQQSACLLTQEISVHAPYTKETASEIMIDIRANGMPSHTFPVTRIPHGRYRAVVFLVPVEKK